MSTNNNAKTGNGRVPVIGPGVRHPVPITLDAAAWVGGIVAGTDGNFWGSNGIVWSAIANTEQVITTNNIPALVTVGAGGDFVDLTAALAFLSKFAPLVQPYSFPNSGIRTEVRILSGTQMNTAVLLTNVDLGWVAITSEDIDVTVNESACPRLGFDVVASLQHAFIQAESASVPQILAHFVFNYSSWSGATGAEGQFFSGLFLSNATCFIPFESSPRRKGFSGFSYGVYVTNSSASLYQFYSRAYRAAAVLASRSRVYMRYPNIRTDVAAANSIRSARQTTFTLEGGDFRKVDGVSNSGVSDSDIRVLAGGFVHAGTSDGGVLGGYNIPVNTSTPSGFVSTDQNGSSLDMQLSSGVIKPTSYTVATVPSAAAFPAHMIHVSNGDSGAPCLAVSNGSNWLRIPLGAAVST